MRNLYVHPFVLNGKIAGKKALCVCVCVRVKASRVCAMKGGPKPFPGRADWK